MNRAQSFLKRIPQYTRQARHLRSVIQHGTPRKWINLARVELERKLRRIELKSLPYLLIIDPCNYCNLKCPLCPTGIGELGRQQAMMSLEHFKRYFDPLAPYLFEAYLHNWGESLLNKQVFDMIAHAQSKNVGTNLSSNLSATSSDDLDRLIESGLEYLVVSLDGTDQETYGKYRIRGKYENVVENMSQIIQRRNRAGKKTPFVEWQFIIMKQNEHQIPEAEMMAEKLGVDLLRFIPVECLMSLKTGKKLPTNGTLQVWKEEPKVIIESNSLVKLENQGLVSIFTGPWSLTRMEGFPCCVVYRKDRDFDVLGDMERPIREIWNNDKYLSARSHFSSRKAPNRQPTVCDTCDIFTKYRKKKSV